METDRDSARLRAAISRRDPYRIRPVHLIHVVENRRKQKPMEAMAANSRLGGAALALTCVWVHTEARALNGL